MIHCQYCGNANDDQSQFCRYCGNRIAVPRGVGTEFQPPRPYAWKTDEFKTQSEARRPTATPGLPPLIQRHAFSQPVYSGPRDLAGNYKCPYCGTAYLPIRERRISTAGWVTFALLLVFTFVFFWIGLLIKEDVMVCPVCRNRVF